MKTLVVVLLACLVATSALGSNNYGFDTMGIFFDTAYANEQMYAGLYQPFNVYLVLLNPLSATNGFECTITTTGPASPFVLSTVLDGVGAIDVDASVNGYMVGCAANYPAANGGCRLVTWQYMVTASGGLSFYISKATTPSLPGNLPVVTGDGVLRRCATTGYFDGLPCACVNTVCRGTPVEPTTFGAVKSLFR